MTDSAHTRWRRLWLKLGSATYREIASRSLRQYLANTVKVRLLGGRLVSPLAAVFYVTHQCNFKCRYCKEHFPLVQGDELGTSETIKLLALIRAEVNSIYITGGEPLLRPDLLELLKEARKLGLWVILHTNGALLDEQPQVIDNIDDLIITLGSLNNERWSAITETERELSSRVRVNLLEFGPRVNKDWWRTVTVNCVISRDNIEDVRGVMALCKKMGFVFSPCTALNDDEPDWDLLQFPPYLKLVEEILETKKKGTTIINGTLGTLEGILKFEPFRCYPTLLPRIYPNGDVFYPCLPLRTVGGNLLELGSFKKVFDQGTNRHGPIPECQGRCYLYAYVLSHNYVHNFWSIAKEYK